MKRLIVSAVALSAVAGVPVCPAHADDITAVSKVDSVIVYPQGAEVTRLAKVQLKAGEHTVILSDLPGGVLAASIRAEGRSGAQLEIGSLDSRRVTVAGSDPAALASERKKIEAEIEKLGDDKTLLGAASEAAKAQKDMLANLVKLPDHEGDRIANGTGATPPPDWTQLLTLVGERTEKAQRTVLELGIKARDLDKAVDELKKKLATLAPTPQDRTEVKVFLTAAAAAQDAEILVHYQIAEASWTALYDARLDTGTKAKAPHLQIVRRASIQQRTSEAWDGIALSLSTARPNAATSAPDLAMLQVDYYQPETGGYGDRGQLNRAPATATKAVPGMILDDAKDKVAAQEAVADITTQPFQSLFAVPGRVNVANTNESKRVLIGQDELDPKLIVRAVPRLDANAYIYAALTIPKTAAPMASGQVALYRDGVLVGNGPFPQLAPGEAHELGFGPDDQIKVRRVVLDDKKGEGGVFTAEQVEVRNYEITVRNLRGTPVQVRVLDRVPVSMNDTIKVESTFSTPPTRRDVNGTRGTVVWELPMAADGQQSLALGYRITAPFGRRIGYADRTDDQVFRFGASTKF